jgi:hypothetical protein
MAASRGQGREALRLQLSSRAVVSHLGRVLINRNRSHSPTDVCFAPHERRKADVPRVRVGPIPDGPTLFAVHITAGHNGLPHSNGRPKYVSSQMANK